MHYTFNTNHVKHAESELTTPRYQRHSSLLISMATIAGLALISGCTTIYYNFWETLGKEKRELLRDNIAAASDDQKEVADEFQDALQRLKATYGIRGPKELETAYEAAKDEYERASAKADALHARVERIDEIAGDLFDEWEGEMQSISDPKLKQRSRQSLHKTKKRFRDLSNALKEVDKSVEPVLVRLKDNVLYLKHNLNAQAIGSLDTEIRDIEKGIENLVSKINSATKASQQFINTLHSTPSNSKGATETIDNT